MKVKAQTWIHLSDRGYQPTHIQMPGKNSVTGTTFEIQHSHNFQSPRWKTHFPGERYTFQVETTLHMQHHMSNVESLYHRTLKFATKIFSVASTSRPRISTSSSCVCLLAPLYNYQLNHLAKQ